MMLYRPELYRAMAERYADFAESEEDLTDAEREAIVGLADAYDALFWAAELHWAAKDVAAKQKETDD